MKQEVMNQLYEPFELKKRPGQGGQTFEYVPSEDIIDRMNRAFAGNWSTKVVFHEVQDDSVLMLVEVSAEDPGTGRVYAHDGWASHPVMRYTGGANQGKVIDLGNAYKSAMSKAIKSAVARWGVDLKREESSTSFTPAPEGMPKVIDHPAMPAEKLEAPAAAPVPNFPPAAPVEPKPAPTTTNIPMFNDNNVISEPPVEAPAATTTEEVPLLTDVQRAAIDHIMSLHNLSFEALSKASLGRETNLPANLEAVKYPDAVLMIQYGNNLSLNQ